jgi:hypothetical protein
MAYLTLLDLARRSGASASVPLIEENLNAAPEFEVLPARAVKGVSYKATIRNDYAHGGFRNVNNANAPQKSTLSSKLFELFYYDTPLQVDTALASADDQGVEAVLAMEEASAMKGFLLDMGQSVWYGRQASNTVTNASSGFMGALDVVDSSMVVSAGGSSGSATSVWAVCVRPDMFEVTLGMEQPPTVGQWTKQQITPSGATAGNAGLYWVNNFAGWVGLSFYNRYCVGQIKLIDSSHTLTDSKLSDLFALFPVSAKPTHYFMNRTAVNQLLKSRSVTLYGGGTVLPGRNQALQAQVDNSSNPYNGLNFNGIPIIVTDSIKSTE